MKHLLITAMIAILIGTIEAVRIRSTTSSETQSACRLVKAEQQWKTWVPSFSWATRGDSSYRDDHHNVLDEIRAAQSKGLSEIRNNNAFFGKDRAPGRDKNLLLEWKCCHQGECDFPSYLYRENQLVPLSF